MTDVSLQSLELQLILIELKNLWKKTRMCADLSPFCD